MSDHFSGPRAISDLACDITDVYAFPSPERPGHLVFVLDVIPACGPAELFSDAINYRLRVRPVTSARAGAGPAFAVGQDEYTFNMTFAAPAHGDRSDTVVQDGTCTTPGGERISFQVGDEKPTGDHGLWIFAGARLDPFFIDVEGTKATEALGRPAFKPTAANSLDGVNVMSIVLEVDAATVFGPDSGPLLAVVGETVTSGGRPVRLERMGRPEVKNIVMSAKQFDTVNRDLEIRDLYNAEDAFGLSQAYVGAYRSRLNANLAFFDGLDGKTDWPADDQGIHPLTELLLADFVVVDISKPFSEDSYLEIERALLAGCPHRTGGGRSLNDDIIDTLYTLLVGGADGPRISDGVDQATRPATHNFPYLVSPNPNPPDRRTVFAALSAPPKEAAPRSG
jgi:Domain of unknown function (DUF4331)